MARLAQVAQATLTPDLSTVTTDTKDGLGTHERHWVMHSHPATMQAVQPGSRAVLEFDEVRSS